VLRGEHRGGHRDALLLGASLALECTGIAADPVAGLQVAADAIDSGRAAEMIEDLAAFGRGIRKP
jgi:anthranilate phosphoribosyltransferase